MFPTRPPVLLIAAIAILIFLGIALALGLSALNTAGGAATASAEAGQAQSNAAAGTQAAGQRETAQAATAIARAGMQTEISAGQATALSGQAATQAAAQATAQAFAQQTATAKAQAAAATARAVTATAQARYTAQLISQALEQMRRTIILTTATFSMQTVVEISQQNPPWLGFVPVSPTRLTYQAYGEVQAGFDLRQLGPGDLSLQNNELIIRLPPPEITVKYIDADRSETLKLDKPWNGELQPGTIERARQYSLEQIVSAACEDRLLERANENAADSLQRLLAPLGYTFVRVITLPPAGCP